MSVIMTLWVKGDPQKLESIASESPERLREISEMAKESGVIAHRFYGTDDGQIMVVDEWPDQESFEKFFEQARSEIEPLMADVGVTMEPAVTFWRKLESKDEIGWSS